jgi:hypothetical protein
METQPDTTLKNITVNKVENPFIDWKTVHLLLVFLFFPFRDFVSICCPG